MYFNLFLVLICFLLYQFNFFAKNDVNIVKTTSGSVKGLTIEVLNQSIDQFLGIPYAEPPLGSLRFAKPKPISKPIEGIIDATKPKYSCIQTINPIFTGKLTLNVSEDCLTLNIWTPKNSTKLKPVMFWIYGGGLSTGSIFLPNYNGRVLATHDIVFVSVNYRLGQLGFLYGADDSAPGNVGFFDQLLALKWVRENIHLFGGDKNQITIFGESAGSWSVSAHLVSPLTKGLFNRAIMQSGANMYNRDRPLVSKDEALLKAKKLAIREGCSQKMNEWLECLRKLDAEKFISGPFELTFPVEGLEYLPLSAQKAFNKNNFNKDLDLMAGVNKDEGSILITKVVHDILKKKLFTKDDLRHFVNKTQVLFHDLDVENITEFYLKNIDINDSNAIKWKIIDFFGDLIVKCPTYLFAKRYAEHSTTKTNVFFYELTHSMKTLPVGQDLGVYHSADLDFVFGLALEEPNSTSEQNIKLIKEVLKLWTNFAKYGKPDFNWPQLIDTKTHSSVTQIKDLNPKNSDKYFQNLFADTCDGFWKDYY